MEGGGGVYILLIQKMVAFYGLFIVIMRVGPDRTFCAGYSTDFCRISITEITREDTLTLAYIIYFVRLSLH